MIDVCLIQVPYHAGDDRHPSAAGPRRLVEAGAAELLASNGHRVSIESVDRGDAFHDTAISSAAVHTKVAAHVRAALTQGQLPLVLAGSCVTSHGVLAGFDHADCGAVWIDVHADFNAPETSGSGFLPGMSLAVLAGHCLSNYWAEIGDSRPLAEETIALFGVRDVWPQVERERLERSAIRVVEWRDGEPSTTSSPCWTDSPTASARSMYTSISTSSPPRSRPASSTNRYQRPRQRTLRRFFARRPSACASRRRCW